MANISTRVSDKQLAEIAKQQYEQRQISKVPSIIIKLPSGGITYPTTNPCSTGQVEMRYMTAWDEDILTNASYIKEGVVLEKLLETLVVSPGFNWKTLIDADREWLIISARIAGYGEEYPVIVKAPTGNNITATVNLNKLKITPIPLTSCGNGEFEYELAETHKLKFRFLSSWEMNNLSAEAAVSSFLLASICEINGNRDKSEIEKFVRYQMTPAESKKFRQHVQQNVPTIDLTYDFSYVTPEGNEETFQSRFPIGSDFFWI
jgi:hypothetical protein